jgi:hypothetical protein
MSTSGSLGGTRRLRIPFASTLKLTGPGGSAGRSTSSPTDGLAWADDTGGDLQTGTLLSVEMLPGLDEINTDDQFEGVSISGAEFEAIWARAQRSLPSHDTGAR